MKGKPRTTPPAKFVAVTVRLEARETAILEKLCERDARSFAGMLRFLLIAEGLRRRLDIDRGEREYRARMEATAAEARRREATQREDTA